MMVVMLAKQDFIKVSWRKKGKLYSRHRLRGWICLLAKAANGWRGMSTGKIMVRLFH